MQRATGRKLVLTALVFSIATIAITSATLVPRTVNTDPQSLFAEAAFYIHIDKIETRNITLIMSDYLPNATLTVSGRPFGVNSSDTAVGLDGTYSAMSGIANFYRVALSSNANVSATLVHLRVSDTSPRLSVVSAEITISGLSSAMGETGSRFNWVVYFEPVNDEWSISSETWTFNSVGQHIPGGFY